MKRRKAREWWLNVYPSSGNAYIHESAELARESLSCLGHTVRVREVLTKKRSVKK